MTVIVKKGLWYDENRKLISEDDKNNIRKEIYTKLNEELHDTKFEKALKWIIIKIIK
ncbi:hypothetical protein ABPS01_02995 [Streptococcus sp. ZJ151]|uniref:hypothetical protein n=1 Tax=Streptococcus jiangjianxini TaxID=3161189 RepID=UPI0032EBBA78